jgi:hypothetical protein
MKLSKLEPKLPGDDLGEFKKELATRSPLVVDIHFTHC